LSIGSNNKLYNRILKLELNQQEDIPKKHLNYTDLESEIKSHAGNRIITHIADGTIISTVKKRPTSHYNLNGLAKRKKKREFS
jgi:hypothetical protein